MIEDRLTHEERLRLECLAQSVARSGMVLGRSENDTNIVDRAKLFEDYVSGRRDGDKPARPSWDDVKKDL